MKLWLLRPCLSLFQVLPITVKLMGCSKSSAHVKGSKRTWKCTASSPPQRWGGDRQPDCTDVIMIASYYLLWFLWYYFRNNKPIYVRRHSIIPSCGTMYGDLVCCLWNYCQPVLTYRLHLVFFYLRIIRCTVRKVYYLLFLY